MKNTAEIRAFDARLHQVVKNHLEKFTRALPHPKRPSRATVLQEVESHNFQSIGISTIVDAFFNDVPVLIQEVVETPSMANYREADQLRELTLIEFERFLNGLRTQYRDRVLFDGESAYLIIQDFEKFDAAAAFKKESKK